MAGRVVSLAACVLLLVGGAWAFAAEQANAGKTWQGELIDMQCYSAGGAKGEGHKDCATKCMSSGIPAGILVDGNAYTLATNPKPLAPYAASTIRVTGELNDQTKVISPDKIEVKEGDNWKEVKMNDAHHGGDEAGQ